MRLDATLFERKARFIATEMIMQIASESPRERVTYTTERSITNRPKSNEILDDRLTS